MTPPSTAVRDLLDEALALPGHQRGAFLDRACADDQALRTEIDELLTALDEAGKFLEAPADADAATAMFRRQQPMIGRQIGHYRIQREIATGGMGTVYEAIQDQPRRIVALKLMKQGIASRSALRRFEYESQILGRLRHPGIAQVFEAGMHHDDSAGDAVPYFVMEYIPNATTLIEYAHEARLGTRKRLELFALVCDAVHHGHQKGIIHRDLKPGNILVDSTGQPRIIDYGVARATDSDMAVTTLQTGVGQLIGTLQYMSPEQCLADPNDLDIRSDVYALGAVLYELLTGKLPYDLSLAPIHEAARLIREASPAMPSTIDRLLHGDVETILMKALEKDRVRRYQSAGDLRDDIQRYLRNEPIVARPPSIVYHLRMFARRHRTLVAAATTLLVVMLAAIVVVSVLWVDARRARDAKNTLADAAVRMFTGQLNGSVKLVDSAGQRETARQIIQSAETAVQGQFAGEPDTDQQIEYMLGQAYLSIGDYQAAEAHLQRSFDLARDLFGSSDRRATNSMAALAALYRQMTDYPRAESMFRELIEAQRRGFPKDSCDTGQWITFADMLHDLGRCAESRAVLQDVLQQSTIQPSQPLGLLYCKTDLASVLWDEGCRAEAEKLLADAIEQAGDAIDVKETTYYRAHRELGRLKLGDETVDEARSHQSQALSGYRQSPEMDESSVDVLLCRELGAMIDRREGRLEEALVIFADIAQRASERIFTEPEWWAAQFHTDQAECLISLLRYDEAEPILLNAYQVFQRRLGDNHHRTQNCIRALGDLYEATGKPDSAASWRAILRRQRCQ